MIKMSSGVNNYHILAVHMRFIMIKMHCMLL